MTKHAELRDGHGEELANVVDWSSMVQARPGVLQTKAHRLLMTYDMRFRDTEQMEPEERAWYLSRLDETLKVLDEGWVMESDWWHAPTADYPATDWEAVGAPRGDRLLEALRHAEFTTAQRPISRLYVSLSWQPPAPAKRLLRQAFLTQRGVHTVAEGLRETIARFVEGTTRFAGLMRPLLDAMEPCDADALATYLHRCVSWDVHPVVCPEPAYDLDWQLTSGLWIPGRPPVLEGRLIQPLTIKSWSRTVRTTVPEALSLLPFPLRYVVRWEPKGLRTSDLLLTWAEKRWAMMYRSVGKLMKGLRSVQEEEEVSGRDDNDGAITAGQGIIDLRRAVRRGDSVVGQLSPTVLVWSDTAVDEHDPASLTQAQAEVDVRVAGVSEALFRQGLVLREEKPNASIQYLATIPGNIRLGIRGRLLSTEVLTAMTIHHHRWYGQRQDTYLDDEPLFVASSDGAPFYVVTHVGNLGHTLVAGPSQTGKTTLFALAIRQSSRYLGRRGLIFDRDNNLKPVTLLCGGRHYALGAEGGLRLQPLRHIDSEVEQTLRAIWLEEVLTGEGLAPDPEERREILRMLRMLAGLPDDQRSLSMARVLLQVPRLKVGLEPFCAGGEYAFLDGRASGIDWGARLLCFEMRDLLRHPRARNAVLSHLFLEMESFWVNGDPIYLWLDEMKWLLDVPRIADGFEEFLLTGAKKNISVWASIQQLVYLQRSKVWQAILDNMPTKFLLPNPQAFQRETRPFYEDLGLRERGLQQLAGATPFRDYLYVSPLGTRMFQCHLHPVQRAMCAPTTLEELAALDALARTVAPEDLEAAWLRQCGFHDQAAYLDRPTEEGTLCESLPSPLSQPLVSSLAAWEARC
jgi:type IV secretion system protein TrbE